MVETIWNRRATGSKLFSIQSRLRQIVRNTKKWCLDSKKKLGMNWRVFESELLKTQGTVQCTKDGGEMVAKISDLNIQAKDQ